jgi:hypothetical protein
LVLYISKPWLCLSWRSWPIYALKVVSKAGDALFRRGVHTGRSKTFILAGRSVITASPISIYIGLVFDNGIQAVSKVFVIKMSASGTVSFFVVLHVHFPTKDSIFGLQSTRILPYSFQQMNEIQVRLICLGSVGLISL